MLTQSNCKNTFIVVGADKGGVGKTTVCRMLLDYVTALGATKRVFDTEPGAGVLKRFFPEAQTVNLSDSADQATIIDNLNATRVTIIDVRAGLLSPTLHLFQRIGFNHGVEAHLAVFHVLGNSIASLSEIGNTSKLLAGGGDHVLVKNHANGGRFFEWDKETEDKYFKPVNPTALAEITNLDPVAVECVDETSQTFAAFTKDTANSRLMRGLVGAWYSDNAKEMDRIGLNNLLV